MASQEQALKEIQEKFGGKWKETRSENIEEFFREMGLSFILRKLASQAHPEVEMAVEGAEVKVNFKIFIKQENLVFKYGEEAELVTSQGKFKGTIKYEDGKLVTNQVPTEDNPAGKAAEMIRELNEEGELIMTLIVGKTTAKRIFTKLPN